MTPANYPKLAKLATILNKYNDTNILLAGRTDSTASDDYDLGLFRRCARSVADDLAIQNVNPARFTVHGIVRHHRSPATTPMKAAP